MKIRFLRPRFISHSITLGQARPVTLRMNARSIVEYTMTEKGLYRLWIQVMGFGFYYQNNIKE